MEIGKKGYLIHLFGSSASMGCCMMAGVLILGAAEYGKEIADILLLRGVPVHGFLDDNPALWGTSWLGIPVLGRIATYTEYKYNGLIVGIEDNLARKWIVESIESAAGETAPPWINVIHPRARIDLPVLSGRGIVVAAGAEIHSGVVVDNHVIVNIGAVIHSHCWVRDFASIGSGAHISTGTVAGTGAAIGRGVTITTPCRIGDWCEIRDGSIVERDISPYTSVRGIPAHR